MYSNECFRKLNLDVVITSFFSPSYCAEGAGILPTSSTFYSGLKSIHVFGKIASEECAHALSSIILHQSGIEGVEIMCFSDAVTPSCILDRISGIFSQPQLRYFVFKCWKDYNFESIFCQFVEASQDFEVRAFIDGYDVVIPARNPDSRSLSSRQKMFITITPPDMSNLGIIFSRQKWKCLSS